MIQVHDTFICKPGQASKMARLLKEVVVEFNESGTILTDLTGQFNKVVMITEYDNLSVYEQSFEKYMHDSEEVKKMKEKMSGYHDMYISGTREIYRVW